LGRDAMKRAADLALVQEPDAKAQRQAPEGQGENWTCKECGNENWPLRTTCNKRGCGAAGPWTCPSCGNMNFQGRMVCNKRTCGKPRPVHLGGDQQMGIVVQSASGMQHGIGMQGGKGMQGGMRMKGGVAMQAGFQAMPVHLKMGSTPVPGTLGNTPAGHPADSWVCKQCNNVNWPLRSVCNKKECGALGPWTCPSCGNKNFQGRDVCNKRTCGLPRPDDAPGPGGRVDFEVQSKTQSPNYSNGSMERSPTADPEGSWTCDACGNVNWPMRTTCNKKGCGLPKPM